MCVGLLVLNEKFTSVADLGRYPGSRIRIIFHPVSRIQQQRNREKKKKLSYRFIYRSHTFQKILKRIKAYSTTPFSSQSSPVRRWLKMRNSRNLSWSAAEIKNIPFPLFSEKNAPRSCAQSCKGLWTQFAKTAHAGRQWGTVAFSVWLEKLFTSGIAAQSNEAHLSINPFFPCILEMQGRECWAVFRIRIRIGYGFNRVSYQVSEQKWLTKTEFSLEISCFDVLDVLSRGLKASPIAYSSFMEA